MRDDWHSDNRAQHHDRPPFGRFFFSWLAIKGYVLYFLRDLILKPAKEAEKKKKRKKKRRGNCITPTATLGFRQRARRARNGCIFCCYWVGCCCVQSQQRERERFLSMDVVDDVIDHLSRRILNTFWVFGGCRVCGREKWERREQLWMMMANGRTDILTHHRRIKSFLLAWQRATHKLGWALAQLSMELAIGPFIIQSGPANPIRHNLNPILLLCQSNNIRQFHPIEFQLGACPARHFTKHYTWTALSIYTISQDDDDAIKLSTLLLLFSCFLAIRFPLYYTYYNGYTVNTITCSCWASIVSSYYSSQLELLSFSWYVDKWLCSPIRLHAILILEWWLYAQIQQWIFFLFYCFGFYFLNGLKEKIGRQQRNFLPPLGKI